MIANRDGRMDGPQLDELLHPSRGYAHPRDVLADPDLTVAEKRAVLSSWASDACAVEAAPALRQPPGAPVIAFDDIIDALRELDQHDRGRDKRPRYKRILMIRRPGVFGRASPDGDHEGQMI